MVNSSTIEVRRVVLRRIVAFFIDINLVAALMFLLGLIFELIEVDDFSFSLAIILFLSKDLIFRNGSIGKKMLKINLISDNKRAKFVNSFYKILRNVTNFIWPIELIILLIFKKRLTDMIFKFDVVGNR